MMSTVDRLKLVIFLDNNNLYCRTQDLLERICQNGNRLTLFGQQLLPLFEYPESQESNVSTSSYLKSEEYLKETIPAADALILLTSEDTNHCILPQVQCFMNRQPKNHSYYSWTAYGFKCLLIGGSVHSRQAAISLRHLLDDSDYPFVGRVLPDPCSFEEFYDIDPSCETEEPFPL
ncbi:uncharacterized protein LOC110236160 isoform X2 [Exaiptasia diaphana]|uniref:Uncharacterized protein n=1 Tax=Exaiptasia diaphana TaxID=2652724 RepID=A0A913X173_EXADI|nr:uncharacterized protein LOC110236160 isoform X2 [Exaiptasia diaphana]